MAKRGPVRTNVPVLLGWSVVLAHGLYKDMAQAIALHRTVLGLPALSGSGCDSPASRDGGCTIGEVTTRSKRWNTVREIYRSCERSHHPRLVPAP